MSLLPENLSFSRKILPFVAIAGLLLAAFLIWRSLPDRSLEEPTQEPPRAAGELADAPRVAGAGVVEPSSEIVDVGTAVSGLITGLYVQPGQFVTRGEPLFAIDDRTIRAQLGETRAAIAEARAAIAEAQTARETAQRQLALYRQIDDPAAVSRAEVIRAEGEAQAANQRLAQARARLQTAQARAASAQTELGRLTVRAPISGEILAVNIRRGEYLSTMGASSEAFIQMGETRPLHARVDVDEDEAVRVEMGAAAYISPRGAADQQVKAEFVRAEPLVVPKRSLTNSASERVDVRVLQIIYELPQTDGAFRVGQQVDAFIPAKNGEAKAETQDPAQAESE